MEHFVMILFLGTGVFSMYLKMANSYPIIVNCMIVTMVSYDYARGEIIKIQMFKS
jgi:hypothetical protein